LREVAELNSIAGVGVVEVVDLSLIVHFQYQLILLIRSRSVAAAETVTIGPQAVMVDLAVEAKALSATTKHPLLPELLILAAVVAAAMVT
jgi:hypothetical protein